MRGLLDLSAMMASQLGIPRDGTSGPPNETGTAETSDTIQRRVPSPDATSSVPKKNKGQKRSRDDPSVREDRDTVPDDTTPDETVKPSKKKRKKKQSGDQQSLVGGSVEAREIEVADPVVRDNSSDEPIPNLALEDDPENASPEASLQLKKKTKKASEQGAVHRQASFVAAENIAAASTSSAPGTSSGGAPVLRKTLRIEFPDRVSFEYDGPTPLIYALNKCTELVSQIKCGPKPLSSVADLIFKDEYVDSARTKLLVRFFFDAFFSFCVHLFFSLGVLLLCVP